MMEEERGEIIDENGKTPKFITAELELPRLTLQREARAQRGHRQHWDGQWGQWVIFRR